MRLFKKYLEVLDRERMDLLPEIFFTLILNYPLITIFYVASNRSEMIAKIWAAVISPHIFLNVAVWCLFSIVISPVLRYHRVLPWLSIPDRFFGFLEPARNRYLYK